MAFQAPTQVPRRRTSYSTPHPPTLTIPSPSPEQRDDNTAKWVLFSPTARTHTTSTDRTRTVGPERLSDFGSFAAIQSISGAAANDDDENALDDQLDEDGTELDSLDDGLHAFRAPELAPASLTRFDQGPPAMLPAHDGLGSFQASSQAVQDQLWQHEQYNPQRPAYGHLHRRRNSSVQRHLDTVEEGDANFERERWQRIEEWRMDQSRALLQEIERETRQRRSSLNSQSSLHHSIDHSTQTRVSDVLLRDISLSKDVSEDDDSFWRRITRTVIRDLIGIDDSLLSVIFGETLPLDAQSRTQEDPLDMETLLAREPEPEFGDSSLWQAKVLQTIAHELGILVHQLCEHPGAFSTYYQMTKDISAEYAGMSLHRLAESEISQQPAESTVSISADTTGASMLSPQFLPTLRGSNRDHEAQWGIDEDPKRSEQLPESTKRQHESEYWESGLDVMMVFRYLRNRFSRRGYMPNETNTPTSPCLPQDASRRAAIIRQHHPLVARAYSQSQTPNRRASQFSGVSNTAGVSSPLVRPHPRRPGSSCASQSAKLSAISSRRTMTSSSRNYWDIGGSETNSAIGVGAGLGNWGEV
ncbi:hypothetical protein Pdw03_2379 [Penicillium digitatum]|uniref:Uncharacterized protein n=3 Tax=Penicillium digitatum TaxID=36651 RepID=K9FPD5_PEND2|nr:hypothetical protein PDIP_19520 [Penicillium digitatum Pd1]EKV11495.1 hypothetical protein PDIG_50280 [Penicillium digitatum PHI26]EKV20173.1 hypothetical protein PDIP_19520 [Penicillium digitatum Pd1]KAG0153389.1 hypothetical protein PDIDSM_5242 [Penicillium digitatum]QQK39525.1 hypothetical protein Pdw03_2379 [Penicillium digitatum]